MEGKMKKNLISVIVPVYQVEQYLEKCIKSIVVQKYSNLEIILVDDGSKDGSSKICDEWEKKDSRIKVIHKENGGLSDARNVGIENACGEYISFIDSDDYIAPDFYDKLYSEIIKTDADIAMCNYWLIDSNGNDRSYDNSDLPIDNGVLTGKQIFFEKMYEEKYGYWVVAWNKLYRKKMIENSRFIVGKYHEDEYFFNEIMPKCKKVACIKDPLYYYVQRPGSIMENGGHMLDKIGALSQRIIINIDNEVDPNVIYEKIYLQIEKMILEIKSFHGINRIEIVDSKYDNNLLLRRASKKMSMQSISILKKFKCICWSISPELARKLFKTRKNIKRRIKVAIKLLIYYIRQKSVEVILIDTPIHANLGDHAIALAEQQVLASIDPSVKYIEMTAQQINKREDKFAKFTSKNKVIFVHGGGFLGSLWPEEEYRFRRILEAFNKNHIVIFPQTITFDFSTPEGLEFFYESKRIYSDHPNLTIFVREMKSYKLMKEHFPTVQCYLVPDIVTLMNSSVKKSIRKGVLFCMRNDLEKSIDENILKKMVTMVKRKNEEDIEFTDTVIDHDIFPKERMKEVQKKLDQFSKAKLVVTDRLHGMIFAALTNTPCIAMSNSNGKVRGVYHWIKNNQYIKFVDSTEMFEKVLDELDLDRQYNYNKELVLNEFGALYMEIRKIRK